MLKKIAVGFVLAVWLMTSSVVAQVVAGPQEKAEKDQPEGYAGLHLGLIKQSEINAALVTGALGYTPAHSGANSDITSILGLSTPLSITQGGTGLGTAGVAGTCLRSNGTIWVPVGCRSQSAVQYHVNSAIGSDTNSCLVDAPCLTPQHAMYVAATTDNLNTDIQIIIDVPGTYGQVLAYGPLVGGLSLNPTITNAGGAAPSIYFLGPQINTLGAIASGGSTLGVPLTTGLPASGSPVYVWGAGVAGGALTTTSSGAATVLNTRPTGTTANSSNQITAVSSLTGVIPGELITDGNACIAANTYITSASGGTIGLSQNAKSSGCGAGDTLTISGASIPLSAAASTTAGEVDGSPLAPAILNQTTMTGNQYCGSLIVSSYASVKISGFTLTNPASCGSDVFVQNHGILTVLGNVAFGVSSTQQIHLEALGLMEVWTGYYMVGNASGHLTALQSAYAEYDGGAPNAVITCAGVTNWTGFGYIVEMGATVEFNSWKFSQCGAVTGARMFVTLAGSIDAPADSDPTTFLPGNASGAIQLGGFYRPFYNGSATSTPIGHLAMFRNTQGDVSDAGAAIGMVDTTYTFGTSTSTTNPRVRLNSAGGIGQSYEFMVGGLDRWIFAKTNATETGANIGSDLAIDAYNDDGLTHNRLMTCTRATLNCIWGGNASLGGGQLTLGSNTLALNPQIILNSATGVSQPIEFQVAGLDRWHLAKTSGAEVGGNGGSDLALDSYADDGSHISRIMTIVRSSGMVILTSGLTLSGGLTGTPASYACLTAGGQIVSSLSACH